MKRTFIILAALFFFLVAAVKYAEVHSVFHRRLTVGVIYMNDNSFSPWYRENIKSITDTMSADGVSTISYAARTREEQIRAVRYCVRQKVDAVVVMPIESSGWDTVLNDCRLSGIPVITVDCNINAADSSLVTLQIAKDARKDGQTLFTIMNDFVKTAAPPKKDGKNYNIAMLLGIAGVNNTEEQRNGFFDAMLFSPDMTNYKIAANAAKTVLTREKNKIDIICAQNDEMALGAVAAIQDAGLVPGKDVLVFSVDGLEETRKATEQGFINGFVSNPPHYGQAVKQAIIAVLDKQSTMLNRSAGSRTFAAETK